jgi:DnaK suppressor protein
MHAPASAELEAIAARLRDQRGALLGRLRQRLAPLSTQLQAMLLDGAVTPDHPGLSAQLRDCDPARLADELASLRQIDDAFARIAAGSYGNCLACGRPIAPERLRAQPAARNCLPCQEAHEQHPHRESGHENEIDRSRK